MMMKFFRVLSSVVILSLFVCSSSFALEIPDGVNSDKAASEKALFLAREQFEAMKQILQAPGMPPDPTINQAIEIIDAKLHTLKITVYFPGMSYEKLYEFYQSKLSNLQKMSNDDIKTSLELLSGPIPPPMQATMASLQQLLNDGKVQAAIGTSGDSRVSILTVYIDPDTLELVERTTLVVATE